MTNLPITNVTGLDGDYFFNLTPNTAYKVRSDAAPADTSALPGPVTPAQLTPASQHAGADPTMDSDLDTNTSIADSHTGPPAR